MIKIRQYEFTDRYQFEKMIKIYYQNNKIDPPGDQMIIDTIGFYTTYKQIGNIYIILYKNIYIGYAIVLNIWEPLYGKVSLKIDEIFIDRNYQKYKPEINLIDHLIKEKNIYSIIVNSSFLKTNSKRIFRFLKFNRVTEEKFIKKVEENS